jgi:hypothetical protein
MKGSLWFLFIFIFVGITAMAQNRVGVWRSHLPYSNASKIVLSGSKVYCATDGGLFYYDKSDNSIEKISKENGLSDSEISTLGSSEDLGITLIAYANANIDLVKDNNIYNIPVIMQKQMLGDKRIYSILINGKYAYLSTGFGIVALNLERKEVSWTNDKLGEGGTQIKVNEMCFDGNSLYASTDQGIYKANLADSSYLQDFNYWKRITDIPNYNQKFSNLAVVQGIVYASFASGVPGGDIIYFWDGMNWNIFTGLTNDNCNDLAEWNGNLIVTAQYNIRIINSAGDPIKFISTGSPKCSLMDENSVFWIADSERGLIQNPDQTTLNVISPNGPSTIFVSDIAIGDDIVYTVPGGLNTSWNNQFRNGETNTFRDNSWSSYKKTEFKDFYRMAVDPADPEHYFIASWGWGLFEYRGDSLLNNYKEDNSSLQSVIPGENFYRLGGLTFDAEGNLWVSNASVAEPLSVLLKKNKSWKSLSCENLVNSPFTGDIIVTQQGYKWMLLTPGRGIIAIDNGELENPDDDRYVRFDVKDNYNAIITNDVYCITEDKDGNIWLGTNKGVLVYYNPGGVFDGDNFYAQQVNVPRNDGSGLGDPLLGTETVTAIAIDGANRKWLGTKNAGVTLVSDDGLTQVHNFTAENSPLLSNSITSIAINHNNGEVFFGSDKGIISFVADATGPAEDFESIFVFPNPVRENFTGDIAITGLLENTTVKITDLNGNLCFEAISLGGQLLWDGKNFSGEKVATGVYLVFCSSEDGLLSKVTKFLVVH